MSGAEQIAGIARAPQPAPDLRRPTPADSGEAYDVAELGDKCPVKPLGFLKHKNYFLDFAGQLIELGTEFRKGELMQLFGTDMAWLVRKWTQWKKVGEEHGKPVFVEDGFSQKLAQEGLIMACAKQGLFDPKGKVRGRGAHLGKDGELVLHCGNQIIVGGAKGLRGRKRAPTPFKPGLVAGFVYPTAPALSPPAASGASNAIGRQMLALLKEWNWKRQEIDAYLLLCWVAGAMIGGAIKVRPHGWIVGPSGAGKSTLQELLRGVLDDWAIATEDATEAGVRQLLDQDTLAVMFDEIEAGEDKNETHRKIIGLARLAYTGGSGLRGGQDHVSKQFVARSCFLFSSIHHQQLEAQDRNRIAVLSLDPIPEGKAQLVLPLPDILQEWGAQLRRRLVEQWPRYAETLAAYQREMLSQGYAGREQDTYGTLLACGDLMLYDAAPIDAVAAHLNGEPDRCFELVRKLARVLDAVRAEAESTTERALKHLTSHRLPASGGREQETVGRWLSKRAIEAISGVGAASGAARLKLKTHGIRVIHLAPDHDKGQGGLEEAHDADRSMYVAIANSTNGGMREIFDGSTWKGGVWNQAFALVNGAIANKKARFDGPAEGCVLVPLEEVIDVELARHEANLAKQEALAEQRG